VDTATTSYTVQEFALPSTVEKLGSTRAKLTIEVPFSDLEPAIRKAYRDVASQVSIPGFRKGHVPPAMIDARVGRGAVLSEAVNAMLPDIYAQAIEEHLLTPLGRPDIEMTKLEDGETVEFTAEVDIVPDFDLPDFSSLTVTVDPAEDLDKAVEERIGMLRERFAEVADADKAAEDGDQVTINLVGKKDGEVLAGATADGLTYVIGSGSMLDGLDEAVTGCKAGDERTFQSTLVGGDYEGQVTDITVTVTAVQERTLPVVDDEFAQMVSQFDTAEQMREDLKKSVERMAIFDQLAAARNKVLDQVIEASAIDVPEALVDGEVDARTSQLMDQLKAAGVSLADYLARMGDPEITTAEQFEASTRAAVERGIRAEIILSRVAEESKVGVSQEDLTNFIFQKAQENGTSPEQEIQHMQTHDHLQEWMAQIRQAKALDTIVKQTKVTDSTGAVVDVAAILTPPPAPADED